LILGETACNFWFGSDRKKESLEKQVDSRYMYAGMKLILLVILENIV
jgi:hypothetical protein